jgi:hypothetical protein
VLAPARSRCHPISRCPAPASRHASHTPGSEVGSRRGLDLAQGDAVGHGGRRRWGLAARSPDRTQVMGAGERVEKRNECRCGWCGQLFVVRYDARPDDEALEWVDRRRQKTWCGLHAVGVDAVRRTLPLNRRQRRLPSACARRRSARGLGRGHPLPGASLPARRTWPPRSS